MAEASEIVSDDVRHSPRRVEKPWGYELIWAHAEKYVGKILHNTAGHASTPELEDVVRLEDRYGRT